MAANCEVGLFINPKSNKNALSIAFEIAKREGVCVDSIPSSNIHTHAFPRVIVVGGERSVKTVVESVVNGKSGSVIGIIPGGSGNVTHRELARVGHSTTIEDFFDANEERLADFYPGITDNNILFNNHVGFGSYERTKGVLNESPGILPSFIRRMSAKIGAVIPATFSDNPIEIYSVVPHIGKTNVFPEQQMLSLDVSRGQIVGENKALKLGVTLLMWSLGLGNLIPNAIFMRTRDRQFTHEAGSDQIWVDGDTFPNQSTSKVIIGRSRQSIKITAISV